MRSSWGFRTDAHRCLGNLLFMEVPALCTGRVASGAALFPYPGERALGCFNSMLKAARRTFVAFESAPGPTAPNPNGS